MWNCGCCEAERWTFDAVAMVRRILGLELLENRGVVWSVFNVEVALDLVMATGMRVNRANIYKREVQPASR